MASLFPNEREHARALLAESDRHAEDATVLASGGRVVGALASLFKAVELLAKAIAVAEGAARFWEKLYASHTPLKDLTGHAVGRILIRRLESLATGASPISELKNLEGLESRKADQYVEQRELNLEYPYMYLDGDEVRIAPAGANLSLNDYSRYQGAYQEFRELVQALRPDL